jgi:type VI secretion system protein ImpK
MPDSSPPDDPFAPRDATVLRPRPGAGRRGSDFPGTARPTSPPPRAPEFSSPSATAGRAGVGLEEFVGSSTNPLLAAAAPLLALAARLGSTLQPANVGTLREQAVQELRAFDTRLHEAGTSREDALVARYALCTFVDSTVANTPWGAQGDWASQSLLVLFHKEVSGGEKFFEIIERLRRDPARYINLIELLWACLTLGYEGKYRHDPNGSLRLGELRHDLYALIVAQRQIRDTALSPHWQGVTDRRNPLLRYVPWWSIAAAALAVVTIAWLMLHIRLTDEAKPIKVALETKPVPVDYQSANTGPNRLKSLLAPEEVAGTLKVEQSGDNTVITLLTPNLFSSGSIVVNPAVTPTLHAVAAALNEVPGRVLIVGHTDDQPIHSIRFADNDELSKARALAVANKLKPDLNEFGRVQWQGAGSSQPRYQPPDTPGNRARNRRVEIIHSAAGDAQ